MAYPVSFMFDGGEVVFHRLNPETGIREQSPVGLLFLYALVVTITCLILRALTEVDPLVLFAVFSPLSIVFIFFVRRLLADWRLKKKLDGTVSFHHDELLIHSRNTTERISYSEITQLELHYNFIRNKRRFRRDQLHNGMASLDVLTRSGERLQVKFVVEYAWQLKKLKPIWKRFYQSHVFMREYMGNERIQTIMFELVPGS